jgi:hypothetical protein
MAFSSKLYRGEPVIDDSTPESAVIDPKKGRGLLLGLRSTPYGEIPYTSKFPDHLRVPRGEWQARCQEMEERGDLLSTKIKKAGIVCKNQQQTNYCWANGPIGTFEVARLGQNLKYVPLSPASIAAPIKGYRNVGGWGEEALRYLVEVGCCPSTVWADNAIDQRLNNEASKNVRALYKVHEWIECVPRDLDELISLLFHGIPVAVGYNWWGHEIYLCDPVWLNGAIAARGRNSWGAEWGADGFTILQGGKLPADDAVAPMSVIAS